MTTEFLDTTDLAYNRADFNKLISSRAASIVSQVVHTDSIGLPCDYDRDIYAKSEAGSQEATEEVGRLIAAAMPFINQRNAATETSAAKIFIADLVQLSRLGNIDTAIGRVIEFFDRSLSAHDYDNCAIALDSFDVTIIEPAISLACLSMTLVAKAALKSPREAFYARLKSHLLSERTVKDVGNLLKGL
jgi:hypothetical protein